MVFVFSSRLIPSVRETKIGSTPTASTATNIGMKANRIFFAIKYILLSYYT
jgi:hypothetical protein